MDRQKADCPVPERAVAIEGELPDIHEDTRAVIDAMSGSGRSVVVVDKAGRVTFASAPLRAGLAQGVEVVGEALIPAVIAPGLASSALMGAVEGGAPWWGDVGVVSCQKGYSLRRAVLAPIKGGALLIFDEPPPCQGSEAFDQAMWEATTDAVLVADFVTGKILNVNPAAERLFKGESARLCAMSGPDFYEPRHNETFQEQLQGLRMRKSVQHSRVLLKALDGSLFWAGMSLTGFKVGEVRRLIAVVRDVTPEVEREAALAASLEQLKTAQETMIRAERLAAVGVLAAGVAHEINNPSAFIMLNNDVIRNHLDSLVDGLQAARRLVTEVGSDDLGQRWGAQVAGRQLDERLTEAQEALADNIRGMERIRDIVRDLRLFARPEGDPLELLDLNAVIDTACNLTRTEVRHRANLHRELGELPLIPAIHNKILQVLVNLIVNAAQAIEVHDAGVGEIVVSSRVEGRRAVVSVRDSGCGVSKEHQSRIFEPFFTTKPRELGTGLGLAVSAEIARQHEGALTVESAPGLGATFSLSLPLGALPNKEGAQASAPQAIHPMRVLVIDDERALLRAFHAALGDQCALTLADGGLQALEILRRDDNFDVILCDLMMPDMDGSQLYDQLLAELPHLCERIVFSSGGVTSQRVNQFIDTTGVQVLPKPLDIEDLIKALTGSSRR